jgi:hypothetical protein
MSRECVNIILTAFAMATCGFDRDDQPAKLSLVAAYRTRCVIEMFVRKV